jgi:WD40 repeat protein/serine/threonine protein kinase
MEIFSEALELTSAEERAVYLDRICGSNRLLRGRVEGLLRAHVEDDFLEAPAGAPMITVDSRRLAEGPGTVIGPYKLREQIGEGGMGVVYVAEQTQPVRRKVALKIIKPGMDTKHVIARFEAERQALAMMDHPNIAKIHDAGATESGRPFFVMELVRGIPITDFCDREQLPIPKRLELFVLVCRAVQHAHQKGIIHRDLKPSNILVTMIDGAAVPKIIDFGVAKATGQSLTDQTVYTAFTQLVGTPLYMSPEQVELSGVDIDTRSDIYSLGVLLYELLTGMTPFDQDTFRTAAFDEMRRIIREQEPPTPSTRLVSIGNTQVAVSTNRQTDPRKLCRSLRGELDWITMKALEKDRRRRYETAGAFAQDIERFRAHRPVTAGPPSAWYRCHKLARRHRLALAMASIALLSSAIIAGMWTWSVRRLDRANRAIELSRNEVKRQAMEARHHLYAADIRQAYQLMQIGQSPKALELLQRQLPAPGEDDIREFTWYYLMRLADSSQRTLGGFNGAVYHVEFSPHGDLLAAASKDGSVLVWDTTTWRLVRTIVASQTEVNVAAFSPDGKTLATLDDDGYLKLWEIDDGHCRLERQAHKGTAVIAHFTHGGKTLVTGGRADGFVKLWDRHSGALLDSFQAMSPNLESAVLSPEGSILATAGSEQTRLWDLSHRTNIASLPSKGAQGVAFSHDGKLLATAHEEGRTVRLWDATTGKCRRVLAEHAQGVFAVAFSRDDRMVISAGDDAAIRFWNTATGNPVGTLLGHRDRIWCVSLSPDGSTLATASSDGTVKLWDARPPTYDQPVWQGSLGDRGQVAFTPDGRMLIVAMAVGRVLPDSTGVLDYSDADLEFIGFDPRTRSEQFHRVVRVGKRLETVSLTSDGAIAVACPLGGNVITTWDVGTGKQLTSIDYVLPNLNASAWRRTLAVKRPNRPIELVDAATGKTSRIWEGTDFLSTRTLSPMGHLSAAVVIHREDQVVIWDLAANRALSKRRIDVPLNLIAFSPDGKVLCASYRGTIQLLEVSTLEPIGSLPGHADEVGLVAFSPDGKTLVSSCRDGIVKFWDLRSRVELLELANRFQGIGKLSFSSAGNALAIYDAGAEKVYLLSAAVEDVTSEATSTTAADFRSGRPSAAAPHEQPDSAPTRAGPAHGVDPARQKKEDNPTRRSMSR